MTLSFLNDMFTLRKTCPLLQRVTYQPPIKIPFPLELRAKISSDKPNGKGAWEFHSSRKILYAFHVGSDVLRGESEIFGFRDRNCMKLRSIYSSRAQHFRLINNK
jgi:hypothetical protein